MAVALRAAENRNDTMDGDKRLRLEWRLFSGTAEDRNAISTTAAKRAGSWR
ncbi:hypothetical protein [Streptomyces parvus]|uniref:hypothetical protein n=1 Tax=Streptomyces parvus TaxID=66428 RepID=UPI002100ECC9|nr:hypothetical protein [Streptomyces parvus]MCQ1579338.1 hypothetical protein [Streptomyces parvus]